MNTNFLDIVPSDNLIRHYAKIMTEPLYIAMAIVDFILVVLLVLYLLKAIKNTRVLQLFKGIALLLIANFLSKVLQLSNYIPTGIKKNVGTIRNKQIK